MRILALRSISFQGLQERARPVKNCNDGVFEQNDWPGVGDRYRVDRSFSCGWRCWRRR